MNEIFEVLKDLPAVTEKIYSDAAANTLKEASKIGVDALKTVRLALFPLQFAAAFQDRLANYIETAIRQVPESQRVAPLESLALPISEKLRFQETGNIISKLYVNLLSRAMDRERVGEAHPAFINIISQLASDEAVLIEQLAEVEYRIFFRNNDIKKTVLKTESNIIISFSNIESDLKQRMIELSVEPETLAQPSLFLTFLEHLVSLGLVSYSNEPTNIGELSDAPQKIGGMDYWCIGLSEFGKLFYTACVQKP